MSQVGGVLYDTPLLPRTVGFMGEVTRKLGIVLPAKDPGPTYPKHLEEVVSLAVKRSACDVLVVDDGSVRDDVQTPARALGVHCAVHAQNRGKGAALRTGFETLLSSYADDDLIGFIDSDGDIPASAVFTLAVALESSPSAVVAAVGSKRSPGSTFTAPPLRRLTSHAFTALSRFLMPAAAAETQVGVKVFTAGFLRSVLPRTVSTGFLLDVELLAAARATSVKVLSVPVDVSLARSTSTIGGKQALRMARELLELSLSTRRGTRYRT